MFLYRLVYILMPIGIFLSLLWVPPANILGDASRILYFHVPVAWVSFLAFVIAGFHSIILLIKKRDIPYREAMAYNSAAVGMVFTVLTVITGSIWAKVSWGHFWNWDPRETSIVILMLIYIAYFSLFSALKSNPNRWGISSVYLIISMIIAPFLIFIVPRVYPSLHPDTIINQDKKIHLEASMRITLFFLVVTFTLLYGYIYKITNKLSFIIIKLRSSHDI